MGQQRIREDAMGEARQRQCLNDLLSLRDHADGVEHKVLTAELDRVIACSGRLACLSHLACSWVASEMASSLMQRYR
jgi:hypothetical protein